MAVRAGQASNAAGLRAGILESMPPSGGGLALEGDELWIVIGAVGPVSDCFSNPWKCLIGYVPGGHPALSLRSASPYQNIEPGTLRLAVPACGERGVPPRRLGFQQGSMGRI